MNIFTWQSPAILTKLICWTDGTYIHSENMINCTKVKLISDVSAHQLAFLTLLKISLTNFASLPPLFIRSAPSKPSSRTSV